jgi:AdoMet-dependent rRNA methyltransferase SPB1
VLGRSEFKQLLRWRMGLRKDLKTLLGAEDEAKKGSHKKDQQQQQQGTEGGSQDGEQEDAETKLLAEMEAIRDAAEKR